MEVYYERDGITIYHGDCREVMAGMEAGSVDTVLTDPPYGLGFMGKDWDHGVPGVAFWEAVLRVAKPGAMLLAFGGTRTHHRLMCAIEDAGWEIRDVIMWVYGSGFPKSLDIGKAIDKVVGAEREVVFERAAYGIGGQGCYSGHSENAKMQISIPATEAAQLWDGWGTALKPAWEPIVVAMKAVEGTFAQNALEHGVAGLWIDGGRIETEESTLRPMGKLTSKGCPGGGYGHPDANRHLIEGRSAGSDSGRWPANLVHDGSDEVVGLFPESGARPVNPENIGKSGDGNNKGIFGMGSVVQTGYYDTETSAARFFYCAKASRGERNQGLEGMPEIECQTGCGGDFPIDDNGRERDRFKTTQQNHHPTVKPLALMEYLCRLTRTPRGGVVLDPFAGSGTTLVAAQRQGRRAIGIEIDEGYCEIAARRIPRQMVLL